MTDQSVALTPRPQTTLDMVGTVSLTDGIQMTHTGALIDPTITFDEFCHGLQNCQQVANGALWALGDLLLYGESRGEWGEMYAQAVDLTKKSYTTLTQAVRLSKAYPPADRVAAVSWSHHREALVEKDPEARHALLHRAAAEGLSREAVRSLVVGDPPAPAPSHTCPQCGHQW
jgi:hypothetical protein